MHYKNHDHEISMSCNVGKLKPLILKPLLKSPVEKMSERMSVDHHVRCGLPPTSLSTSQGGSAGVIAPLHHRVHVGELASADKNHQPAV